MRYCLVPKQYNAEICSTGYCVIRPDATITHPNYILHIISSKSFQDYVEQNQSGASYPSITDNCIRDFIIPIPPMEVQERIVEILDKFTELQAELQAELALREKQYTYFRDQLLSFEMLNRGGYSLNDIKYLPLGEVATLQRGRVISKVYLEENKGNYPVYSSQTVNNGEIGSINTFDFDQEAITWTTDGANAGTIFHRQGKFSITNVCGLITIKDLSSLNYRFLFYWLGIVAKDYVYYGMGNPKLMSNQIAKVSIPIPPMEEQERIVGILDRFETMVHSIKEGLPREIELRRKQYEYFRDQLLTFPKD